MTQPESTPEALPSRPFARFFPMALLKAREAVTLRFRPILRHHGLTEQQWRVLRTLWGTDRHLRPMELSELTFISMPSLSRLLKTLEGRVLIKRERHVGDMRGSEFALTSAGSEMVKNIVPLFEKIYAQIDRELGGVESGQLFHILEHVVKSLGLPGEGELSGD